MRFRDCALLLLAAGVACSSGSESGKDAGSNHPVIVDDFGDTTRIDSVARRIVSLNPTTTEILFAIGAGSKMVGRSKWDSWPDSAKYVQAVGDALRPNVEAVLAAKPDLVLLYASSDNRTAATQLRAAGVKTVSFKIDQIVGFEKNTLLLGQLTGEESRAKNVVDSVHATLERVRRATANLPKVPVFLPTWEKPIITIGHESFMNDLVDIAGGRNVYGDIKSVAPVVTLEDVISRKPEVVLSGPGADTRMYTSSTWMAIPAVKNHRVLMYDTMVVGRPSVTLGMAAINWANLLHPGVVK